MSLDHTGGVGFLLNVAVKNAVRYVLSSQEGSLSGVGEFAQCQLFVIDKEGSQKCGRTSLVHIL